MAERERGSQQKSLTPQAALRALRDALTFSTARVGKHIRDMMAKRTFEMNDVLQVAREGAVRRPPDYDIKRRTWEYVVEGQDLDGRKLEIVFAVDETGRVTLITGRRP